MNESEIKLFIADICSELRIKPPELSMDTSCFMSDTMRAMVEIDKNDKRVVLHIQPPYDLDFIYAIAHELRHIWQMENQKKKYFQNYKTRNELSVDDYNLQPAEIDAHAYALCVLSELGVMPLFKGYSDRVKEKIYSRAKVLAKLYEY